MLYRIREAAGRRNWPEAVLKKMRQKKGRLSPTTVINRTQCYPPRAALNFCIQTLTLTENQATFGQGSKSTMAIFRQSFLTSHFFQLEPSLNPCRLASSLPIALSPSWVWQHPSNRSRNVEHLPSALQVGQADSLETRFPSPVSPLYLRIEESENLRTGPVVHYYDR